MTIDIKKLKVASPDHPIYNNKFQVYSVDKLKTYKEQVKALKLAEKLLSEIKKKKDGNSG